MPCSRSPVGGCVSQHALQEVSQHALQQVSSGGVCIPACIQVQAHTQGGNGGGSGPGPHPRGKLRGIRSRPTPKGEMEGDQVQVHTQGGN